MLKRKNKTLHERIQSLEIERDNQKTIIREIEKKLQKKNVTEVQTKSTKPNKGQSYLVRAGKDIKPTSDILPSKIGANPLQFSRYMRLLPDISTHRYTSCPPSLFGDTGYLASYKKRLKMNKSLTNLSSSSSEN